MADKMTGKMILFVSEYLIDFNGTQAAIRAGYSPDTAQQIASENLSKPVIREAIDKEIDKILAENRAILKKKVLDELEAIAFHNVSKDIQVKTEKKDRPIYDDQGEKIGTEPHYYKTVEIIDTDKSTQTKAIASIKQNEKGVIEIKYHDKTTALDKLGRYLTLFTDKIEHSGEINNISREEREQRIKELTEKADA